MPRSPPAIIEYLLPSFIVSERGDGSLWKTAETRQRVSFGGFVGIRGERLSLK